MYEKVFNDFLHALAAAYPDTSAYFLPNDDFMIQEPPNEQLAMEQLENPNSYDKALDDFINGHSFGDDLSMNDVTVLEKFLFATPSSPWSSPTTHTRAGATQRFNGHVPLWVNATANPQDDHNQRGIGAMASGGLPPIDGM